MPVKLILVIPALALALPACQRENPSSATTANPSAATGTTAAAQDTTRKWAVPPAMMAHLANLEKDLDSNTADHAALAAKIDGHLRALISSCTMEGEAHQALHDWLMPFRELAKAHAEATDPGARAENIRRMKQSFDAFHARFE